MARPTPVLPLVGSTMVPPGSSCPSASAFSTIFRAIRSLMDPPGFRYSSLTKTVASMPAVTEFSLTSGVLPIRSRTVRAYFMAPLYRRAVTLKTPFVVNLHAPKCRGPVGVCRYARFECDSLAGVRCAGLVEAARHLFAAPVPGHPATRCRRPDRQRHGFRGLVVLPLTARTGDAAGQAPCRSRHRGFPQGVGAGRGACGGARAAPAWRLRRLACLRRPGHLGV